MKIIYRQGIIEDLDTINSLIFKSIKQMKKQGIQQWDELYPTCEDFREDIELGNLYVGFEKEQIVVIYVLNQEADDDYKMGQWRNLEEEFFVLHRLCVNPFYQGKGIAKIVMKHIEEEVIIKGGRSIRLDVFSKNPYALKLYTHCGYKNVGKVNWRKGEFFLMEKCFDREGQNV